MSFRVNTLQATFKKSVETIPFTDFNYFYGEMGAGKSTIARLIDYCLGSKDVVMTPALQSEFVAASLTLSIGDVELTLERERGASQLIASWEDDQVIIPARQANGPVLPNTEVEVLSDLIFYLQGMQPPRVRRSQVKLDSDLERLSLRDLLWYCYLDQDSMDSSFFNLDREAETFRRLKSRNVLRSILGVHQERVAELELQLEEVRHRRTRCSDTARVLQESLEQADVSTEVELNGRMQELGTKIEQLTKRIQSVRKSRKASAGHVADRLRSRARQISAELEAIDQTVGELIDTTAEDRRHRNEILALSTKVRRLASARAVLNDVEFLTCPRCTQHLPARQAGDCPVCGLIEDAEQVEESVGEQTEADIRNRVKELDEMVEAQSVQLKRLRRRRNELLEAKQGVDEELADVMAQYDSAYLAEVLDAEKRRAQAEQEQKYLKKLSTLQQRVTELHEQADALAGEESKLRRELRDAQAAAEQDLSNVTKLAKLFLDCLLRAKIPGFEPDDIVHISPPWFLPEVIGKESGELATTSFSTLGSGGKKNLFKCCFAVAVHRLAASLDTFLPQLLIVDSPMKNISERENREQFEGFHEMLYELADSELRDTQFILIDKEFCNPAGEYEFELGSRHMRVKDDKEPPLIPYYRGK